MSLGAGDNTWGLPWLGGRLSLGEALGLERARLAAVVVALGAMVARTRLILFANITKKRPGRIGHADRKEVRVAEESDGGACRLAIPERWAVALSGLRWRGVGRRAECHEA